MLALLLWKEMRLLFLFSILGLLILVHSELTILSDHSIVIVLFRNNLLKESRLPLEKTMENFDKKRLPKKLEGQLSSILEGDRKSVV